jgi:glutamine synthetase
VGVREGEGAQRKVHKPFVYRYSGFLKSITLTVDELPEALEEGVGFDGSSVEGFVRIEESDMIAKPDPSTFAILPWTT